MKQEREPMTIDDLASIYRVESKSKALSEVRGDFYPAMATLSDSVRKEYEEELQKDSSSIFSEGINERRKKILLHSRNIVDLRMEKICKLALLGSMGADNAVDHLTSEEKEYYTMLLDISKKHRALIETTKHRPKAVVLNVEPKRSEKIPEPPIIIETEKEEEEWHTDGVPSKDIEEESVTIRVLDDLPLFSGPDRDYELKKEDIVKMPSVMANALIMREKAVKIDVKL